jgi:hypothetical protein
MTMTGSSMVGAVGAPAPVQQCHCQQDGAG